jgi:hypothetical protein
LEWVLTKRGDLVAAALTLCRAWYAAGCPAGKSPVLGSFEDWSRLLGGVLQHIGVPEFLGNLQDLYVEMDDSAPQ